MSALFTLSVGLTKSGTDAVAGQTYVGQAHFAGTGPAGKTCRECRFFYPLGFDKHGDLTERRPFRYRSHRDEDRPGELHDARCNRPIANKADRLFPHSAQACRLFEPSDHPPIAVRPPKPKKPRPSRRKRRAKT